MPETTDRDREAFKAETLRRKLRDAGRAEIDVMRTCFDTLSTLDYGAQERVLSWLSGHVRWAAQPDLEAGPF